MDGMEGAIAQLVAHFNTAVPAKTVELRERLGIDPEADGEWLPDVAVIANYNRAQLALEEYPAVLIAGQETPQMRRVDVGGGKSAWLVRYNLRAFVWVRGETPEMIEAARSRLTLAVREILLQRKQVTASMMIDDTTVRESFSELIRDERVQATVGASYVGFSAWVQEDLADVPAAYGDLAQAVDLDTTVVPPHPAD